MFFFKAQTYKNITIISVASINTYLNIFILSLIFREFYKHKKKDQSFNKFCNIPLYIKLMQISIFSLVLSFVLYSVFLNKSTIIDLMFVPMFCFFIYFTFFQYIHIKDFKLNEEENDYKINDIFDFIIYIIIAIFFNLSINMFGLFLVFINEIYINIYFVCAYLISFTICFFSINKIKYREYFKKSIEKPL